MNNYRLYYNDVTKHYMILEIIDDEGHERIIDYYDSERVAYMEFNALLNHNKLKIYSYQIPRKKNKVQL